MQMSLFKPKTIKKYYLESYHILGHRIQRLMKLFDNSDFVWLSEFKLYEELRTLDLSVEAKIKIGPTIEDDDLLLEYLSIIPPTIEILENICKKGLVKSLDYLCGKVDFSIRNHYLLFVGIWFNHPMIVEILLRDQRVDPSINNNAAISIAANSAKCEIVEILKRDPRVDVSSALVGARERNYFHIVELLCQ
ncbi:hypothetical protein HDV04_001183 [Boothiomyces sp. JEL0838]|nr:hypothetical protein HDV04_001183 [Boothiomyces sp. JEL0838]